MSSPPLIGFHGFTEKLSCERRLPSVEPKSGEQLITQRFIEQALCLASVRNRFLVQRVPLRESTQHALHFRRKQKPKTAEVFWTVLLEYLKRLLALEKFIPVAASLLLVSARVQGCNCQSTPEIEENRPDRATQRVDDSFSKFCAFLRPFVLVKCVMQLQLRYLQKSNHEGVRGIGRGVSFLVKVIAR